MYEIEVDGQKYIWRWSAKTTKVFIGETFIDNADTFIRAVKVVKNALEGDLLLQELT
jgi:NADPH-dependent glutamate synthase beta subunit-like oxidoreductase